VLLGADGDICTPLTSAHHYHLHTNKCHPYIYGEINFFTLNGELMTSLCPTHVQLMSESGHKLLFSFIIFKHFFSIGGQNESIL